MLHKASRAVVVAALVALAACGGKDKVYIGVAGPLEASNGASMRLAAEMAAREINADGGIDGRLIELVFKNDSANATRAIQIAQELRADERVVAVIGHVNSSASLSAAGVYNDETGAGDPVVQISPASSSPALTAAGPWTFRVTPTDLEFSPVLAQWAARKLGRRRAAVMYLNDDYGQGVRASFERAFRQDGGTVVSADPYLPAVVQRGTELDAYLTRAIRRGADALVIGGQADAGLKIVQAARRLGYTGPILGSDGMTGIKDAGAAGEGVFVSSAFLPDRDTDQARRFVSAYRSSFNTAPDHRGAMTYDIMYMLRGAIASGATDRESVRDYIASIGLQGGRPAYEGVSGTIRFDTAGDVRGKPVTVGIVRRGQLVTAR